MDKESDWDCLTSPPHDMETMIEFCKDVGLKLHCFINVTLEQMNQIVKIIQNKMRDGKQLYFFISVVMVESWNKIVLKQCLAGIDAKFNGSGCFFGKVPE
eukprot:UN02808